MRPSTTPNVNAAPDEQLLTAENVAALLQVSRQTLANWRVAGRGPAGVKIGRGLRYRRSALMQWIEAQEDLRPQPF